MSTPEEIASARHLAITAHGPSGETVAPPAWVVLTTDGRLGLWPASTTATQVQVEPCDRRGRTQETTSPIGGRAEVVRSGALFDEVRGRVREKYGWRARLGSRHAGTVVLVTLDPPAGT